MQYIYINMDDSERLVKGEPNFTDISVSSAGYK